MCFKNQEWLRQESNLNLELRKLLYYPLYYEAIMHAGKVIIIAQLFILCYTKKGNRDGCLCSTYGSRTRHSSVKGRRLSRLTNAAFGHFWDGKGRAFPKLSKNNFKNHLSFLPCSLTMRSYQPCYRPSPPGICRPSAGCTICWRGTCTTTSSFLPATAPMRKKSSRTYS